MINVSLGEKKQDVNVLLQILANLTTWKAII